jgi:hypothetical protein
LRIIARKRRSMFEVINNTFNIIAGATAVVALVGIVGIILFIGFISVFGTDDKNEYQEDEK